MLDKRYQIHDNMQGSGAKRSRLPAINRFRFVSTNDLGGTEAGNGKRVRMIEDLAE
jgi:hypothetical protein